MFLSKLDSLTNARKLITDNQKVTEIEEISIHDAHKRVLAEDVIAFHDSPPFDKSAMDGYKENFSSDSYTLTLTAPDGSTRTFKSKKTN